MNLRSFLFFVKQQGVNWANLFSSEFIHEIHAVRHRIADCLYHFLFSFFFFLFLSILNFFPASPQDLLLLDIDTTITTANRLNAQPDASRIVRNGDWLGNIDIRTGIWPNLLSSTLPQQDIFKQAIINPYQQNKKKTGTGQNRYGFFGAERKVRSILIQHF